MLAPAAAYLALVAADYAHGVSRGFLSNDAVDHDLWLAQAAALALVALGVAWAWVRERRARTRVARLVIELGDAPAVGKLQEALAGALGDPALELAYPLEGDLLVDAQGRPVSLGEAPGRTITPLVRGGRPVAVIAHRADLLDDPGVLEEVGAAAGLALDHERLQAQARARLEQLRASRARTVEAGDAERRRLERDLHDGAQQRLVVLSFALRLLRAEVGDQRGSRQRRAARARSTSCASSRAASTRRCWSTRASRRRSRRSPRPATRRCASARCPTSASSPPSRPPRISWSPSWQSGASTLRVQAQRADGRLRVEIDGAQRRGSSSSRTASARSTASSWSTAPRVRAEIPCGS